MTDYSKFLVKEYTHWLVNVHENQGYLGRCVVWCKREDALDLADGEPLANAPADPTLLFALEDHLGIPEGTLKVYVLIEQLEATYQLMEIRAALGKHFVGYIR